VQSLLRFPGDHPHFLALVFLAFLDGFADLGFQTILPGRFGQHSPAMRVAAFGNAALPSFIAAGAFAGCQPEKVHERSGIGEPNEVSDLGHQRHGLEHLHAAQTHQCAHHRFSFPIRQCVLHRPRQPFQSFSGIVNGMYAFLKHNVLRRLWHDQAGKVTLMGLFPTALAGVAKTQPEQEAFEALRALRRSSTAADRARIKSRMASSSWSGYESG
jgi:hypothetical protein